MAYHESDQKVSQNMDQKSDQDLIPYDFVSMKLVEENKENDSLSFESVTETRYAPLSDFILMLGDGEPIMYNEKLDVLIPVDIDNADDIKKFKIDNKDVESINEMIEKRPKMLELIRSLGYEGKWCVTDNNEIICTFETEEEKESFILNPENNASSLTVYCIHTN